VRPASGTALADHIGRLTVSCQQRDIDRYKRIVAVCAVAGVDIGGWMVEQGWALYRRYSKDYIDEESVAAAERRGIWRGSFMPPWEWRRAH
jgi:endonuclease YncB( thermonuclease family)